MQRVVVRSIVGMCIAVTGCSSSGVPAGGGATDSGAPNTGGAPSDAGGATSSNGGATSSAGGSNGGAPNTGGTPSASGGANAGGSGASSGGAPNPSGDAGTPPDAIATWTDSPGACPDGMPKVVIQTADELASAARGEDAYANDAPATCYFLENGDYTQSGVVFYVLKGGEPGGTRRLFIGESRQGVVIHGRGNVEDGVSDVTMANLTFDLTGYSASGAFNTLNLSNGRNISVDHVTFTGDCNTGLMGGHIETNGTTNVLVDSCLIEKFGHCGGGGHEDHGIYLASGSHITIRNSVVSGNSSRGIQMYTASGAYGTLDTVVVERSRITGNGHADYEDGVVINAAGTGTIKNVTLSRDIFDHNYYSGIRFVGGVESGVLVDHSTFDSNGAGSTSASRSEINIDSAGGGAGTTTKALLFNVGNLLINDCYDAASLGFGIGVSFVHGAVPAGAAGNCVAAGQITGDPSFANAAAGDYHPGNAAASAFGAYAP
jgi:hypothetical protein